MKSERPRARRYPFVASIELTDLQSEIRVIEQMSDLSLFGCHADATKLLPKGTKVRIKVVHAGATFIALGKVAHSRENSGMGLVFTTIESNHELVLEKWIAELREARERVSS